MFKSWLLVFGVLYLAALEILRVYFIMPFPGSQESDTINIAYFLDKNILWLRLIGLLLTIPLAYAVFKQGKLWKKILLGAALIFYGLIFYAFNFRFLAEKMFYQPKLKVFAGISENKVDTNSLAIAAVINGEAKAYPIQIIGYHHQVLDSIGGEPVMVTYCTVCRTGRIYSPFVDGRYERFRLVGMDHYNAMFEDASTKSWWRQVTGEAITGDEKGKKLPEIFSSQVRLGTWMNNHPQTKILQPDTNFTRRYENLTGYDSGTIAGRLEKRDSASWNFKSWVVGLVINNQAKAFDWNELEKEKMINDSVSSAPVVLLLENDGKTFHAFESTVNKTILHFKRDTALNRFRDEETGTAWNYTGVAEAGKLQGVQLKPVSAYQEFWHSWHSFHPQTTKRSN